MTGTVVVEASAWLEDNQWILDLAARDSDRSIVGFVGHIEPDDPDYTSHLDRFCANPLFRGLRLSSALVDGPRDALVEACRELLQRWVAQGPRHIGMWPAADPVRQARLFGEHVLPYL